MINLEEIRNNFGCIIMAQCCIKMVQSGGYVMNMPKVVSDFLQVNHYKRMNKQLTDNSIILTRQVRNLQNEIQASTDITTNTGSSANTHYIGNPYRTYDAQVTQLGKLYDNTADWGCMVTKNIIDIRTAFAAGEGIAVKKREGFEGSAENELKWVEDFMQF